MNRANRVRWFTEFSQRVGVSLDASFNLMVDVPVDPGHFRTIQHAVTRYIATCFGEPDLSETQVVERLDTELGRLVNRTPNGVLMPKLEFAREFNELHRVIADWVRSLRIEPLIARMFCPITVRIVKGKGETQAVIRPYSSTKIHVDLWSGDPSDNVGINLPVLGDIHSTTVAFYHPPVDFERKWLRVMKDFDEGREIAGACTEYPTHLQIGHAYFYDATVLHKTTQREGGTRVSLQLLLRRPTSEADLRQIEQLADAGRIRMYIDPAEWFAYGTSKYLLFRDTFADSLKGVFTEPPYNKRIYDVVDSLEDIDTTVRA